MYSIGWHRMSPVHRIYFKDSEESQNRVIHELAENNCAGLCIKMKRYFDRIPQNMIDLANKYGLPLLELPLNTPCPG